MNRACCTRTERPVSPLQAIRLADIDPILTVAALPPDHPHSISLPRTPALDQSLLRSPSILSKLKNVLPRKSTNKSLATLLFDEDNVIFESNELLESIEERRHQSPSSIYSNEDCKPYCQAYDGSVDDPKTEQDGSPVLEPTTRITIPQIEVSQSSMLRPALSTGTTATSLLTPAGESLADYERKLSVCGDDRRKDSACDLQRYREMKQEDKAAGLDKPKTSSSSRPNKDTLIENALERQLQQKALFRSPSKAETEAPSFLTTSWSGASFHAEDSIDPLDSVATVGRSAPESWCRWPSHSRAHRAGTATIDDDMIIRDFAMPVPYANRAHLKSPVVMKLRNVKRYYTDLLTTTTGFHGKGHRTSIFTAGKLEDPELELLPPSLPDIPEPTPVPEWIE